MITCRCLNCATHIKASLSDIYYENDVYCYVCGKFSVIDFDLDVAKEAIWSLFERIEELENKHV